MRNLMIGCGVGCLMVLVSVVGLGADVGPLHADACTLARVKGTYGYAFSGAALHPSLGRLDIAAGGALTIDATGAFTGSDVLSLNGQILPRTLGGTLRLGANCTATATFTDSLGQTVNVSGAFVDGLREFRFIQTDPGTIVVGALRRR